ncbi:hypothetical protein TMEC54S_02386 [Thauera mechernichensis]
MGFQFSRPVAANLANSAKAPVTPESAAAHIDAQRASTVDDDDRIHCTDCSWLSMSGACRAAAPKHKPVVANRGYQPVRDLPRRCEGFAPYANNPDQRRGFERWPGLAAFHSSNATPPGVSHSVGGISGDSK